MTSASPKTFRIKSFGCQMNVYDGERMAELLGADGMTAAPEGEDADRPDAAGPLSAPEGTR